MFKMFKYPGDSAMIKMTVRWQFAKCIQVLQWYPTKSAKKITQQPCATHGLHDFARLQIPVTKRSQCFEQPPKETCFRIDLATWRLGDVKIGQRSEGFSPIFGWCLTARFGLQFSLDLFFFIRSVATCFSWLLGYAGLTGQSQGVSS